MGDGVRDDVTQPVFRDHRKKDDKHLLLRITDRLRQQNLLVWSQLHDLGQCGAIHRSSDDRCQSLGSTEEIDILTDETCVGGGEELCVTTRLSALAEICDVNQVNR